ncbi:hypothetical protein ROJ8625_02068 [Roseivivax jejudonensis]|uniref:Glycosyl transferase family 2 n=1 Tax=Roseivivax jejudonensis TaxID=1529041 RepID=A0A1X6Z6E3_9RHOB|nr:glycosyltransferase family 2 protein [Roseivivax jejudonensis]SLN42412.1 hypothetical protein ROJ8625_02068 [Roseivivax jejudonensis]
MTRWGLVCTTNAAPEAVLDFAAWHLEAGATRLHLYRDLPAPELPAALRDHTRIRVTDTDGAFWDRRGGRPVAHQVRQCRNARHAYNCSGDLDWLGHIDTDEFLLPEGCVAEHLSALPDTAFCARLRPVEALAPGDGDRPGLRAFKSYHIAQDARATAARRVFGDWAEHLSGGFLSHVAGKLFVRTGASGVHFRIHNVMRAGAQNPGQTELPQIALAHLHADSWPRFRDAYRFRLDHGSYRAELKPQARGPRALSLHDLFARIEATGGEAALAEFFDDVATATPRLCAALDHEGLLLRRAFDPESLRLKHFPGVSCTA